MGTNAGSEPTDEPVVLGAQMAAAQAAEARHQAQPHEPSPLIGVAYGQPRAELSVLHFKVVSTDEIVDDLVTQFAAAGRGDREARRSDLTMDDFYTLLTYARRAAVRAIRSRDEAVASRGVTALALIDLDRVDWRDVAWQAGLLSYAIHRIGGTASGAFEMAATLADGESAAFLRSLASRPPADLSEWGFREVQTAEGAGLIEDEGAPYRPESDLVGLAEALAAGVRGDIWQLSDPVIGSDLPTVWLQGGTPEDLEPALRSITGCVTLQGTHAAQDSSIHRAQHMVVFLAETQDPQAASIIAAAAGPGSGSSFAALAVAARALCAVMIARSFVRGIPSLETKASLQRFRPALTAALTC